MVEIKYGDRVKVTKGFYEGCKGIVVGCCNYPSKVYTIEISKIDGTNALREKSVEIYFNNVEKIEK